VDRFEQLLVHLDRGDISDGGVESGPIVEAVDEGEDVALGLGSGLMALMNEIGLQAR
jgi:hypothetical protein